MNDKSNSAEKGRERQEAVARFRAAVSTLRRGALEAAGALSAVEKSGAHLERGASSIAQFGEREGLSASETRTLCDLNRAIAAVPPLSNEVAQGTIPVASGGLLGQVLTRPEVLMDPPPPSPTSPPLEKKAKEEPPPAPDVARAEAIAAWLEAARRRSVKDFARIVMEKREQAGAGKKPLHPWMVLLNSDDERKFEDGRDIASRKARKRLSRREAFLAIVDRYLDQLDPGRLPSGTRRLPDTTGLPDRHKPAEVARAVRARFDGMCPVPYCDNHVFKNFSHRVAHCRGGGFEEYNLDDVCTGCHDAYQRGDLRITGPPSAPVFTDRWGRRLDQRCPPPETSPPPPTPATSRQPPSKRPPRRRPKAAGGGSR